MEPKKNYPLKMSPRMIEKVKAEAERQDIKPPEYIRRAIEERLDRDAAKHPIAAV